MHGPAADRRTRRHTLNTMICFRLLESDDPATPLAEAVATLRRGEDAESVYAVNPKSFRQVPNAPFAYWVSERIRGLFTELPPFEGDGREVRVGLQTSDDFRFVRTAWETPEAGTHQAWFPFAKGGSYSPFYADVHLHVNWETDGHELDAFIGSVLRNTDYYFRPGLTWPLRGIRFSAQAVASGCIFSVAGKMAMCEKASDIPFIGATFNSAPFDYLIRMSAGKVGGVQYEVGLIGNIPMPSPDSSSRHSWNSLFSKGWMQKRRCDQANLISHAFYAPALRPTATSTPTTASDA